MPERKRRALHILEHVDAEGLWKRLRRDLLKEVQEAARRTVIYMVYPDVREGDHRASSHKLGRQGHRGGKPGTRTIAADALSEPGREMRVEYQTALPQVNHGGLEKGVTGAIV